MDYERQFQGFRTIFPAKQLKKGQKVRRIIANLLEKDEPRK